MLPNRQCATEWQKSLPVITLLSEDLNKPTPHYSIIHLYIAFKAGILDFQTSHDWMKTHF